MTRFLNHPLAAFSALALAGGIGLAFQVRAEAVSVSENDPLLQAWRQQNAGAPAPELVQQENGGTRIVWTGNLAVDAYATSVATAGGNVMSPLKSGRYAKVVLQSDLRGSGGGGETHYFQMGWTSSNDRSVLSQSANQLNNLQIGRSGETFQVALGDVTPNYSSLSTALGARGVMGQVKLGEAVSVHAFSGVVAPSWEALSGKTPRYQFLRDVQGGKVEYQLLPSLKIYATSQMARDDEASLPAGSTFALPLSIHSSSGGFQFTQGDFQVAGEYAHGGSEAAGQTRTAGNALILDASWRLEKWSLRGGYHDLDPHFISLSGMVQPGIAESYLSADWSASHWLSLSGDVRNSRARTAATAFSPASTTETNAESLRANLNFGPNLPGWGASFQQNRSQMRNPQDQLTRNQQSNAALNFSSPKISASLGYGIGFSLNEAFPDYSSDNSSWQVNFGRNYSDATPSNPQTWNLGINFNGAVQKQEMGNGSATGNFNYGLGLNAQRDGWGSLQMSYSEGLNTQGNGQPDLKQRGLQLDATRSLNNNIALKLFLRDNKRNIGMPEQEARETVSGVQLASPF